MKASVIGAGPSGLCCSYELVNTRMGKLTGVYQAGPAISALVNRALGLACGLLLPYFSLWLCCSEIHPESFTPGHNRFELLRIKGSAADC